LTLEGNKTHRGGTVLTQYIMCLSNKFIDYRPNDYDLYCNDPFVDKMRDEIALAFKDNGDAIHEFAEKLYKEHYYEW